MQPAISEPVNSETDNFIKNLTSTSLSQLAERFQGYTPPQEVGYANQPQAQPIEQTQGMPVDPVYLPPQQQQTQQEIPEPQEKAPKQRRSAKKEAKKEEEDQYNKVLHEVHEYSKEAVNREQILKENYLKAKQEAAQSNKELLLKDLKLSQYLYNVALENEDTELQGQMHNQQMDLHRQLMKHDADHDKFLQNFESVLEDKLPVVDYAPTYEEEAPAYQESAQRKAFRKDNSWYDFDGPQYNTELVQTAHEIEKNMINEYQLRNMANHLETPYYFEDLKARVHKHYGIDMQPSSQPPYQQQPVQDQQWLEQQQNVQPPANPFVQQQPPQYVQQQYQQPPQFQQQQQFAPPPQMQQQRPYTAPVVYGSPPAQAPANNNPMYSQKAFEMFVNSLNPTMAPQISKLSHDQKIQLFEAAIKNQGRT